MSTPLYKKMKQKGSTFYAFPSTKHHTNPNFSKFVLLNIPRRDDNTLDFDNLLNFDIHTDNINPTYGYADQLIESLRNYVANYDTTIMESKISNKKEFYNIQETKTPTEKIFWKWLRKLNCFDLEPATHKVDWNKNLSDFDNPNIDTTVNPDYFRQYLWKEREVIDYLITTITYIGSYSGYNNVFEIKIEFLSKFKTGDKVIFDGNITSGDLLTGVTYDIIDVDYDEEDNTILYINIEGSVDDVTFDNLYVKLNYNRLVQYIGEINAKSEVRTATKDETEVIAYIPHQAGRTPSILFNIHTDTNYYPGLELPILTEQIQTEIRGAENYTSPIRKNPQDYPGLYFGQFDNDNKTYETSSGDKIRMNGDYYGILLNSNVGTHSNDYFEKLIDFNSNNIDGLNIDFNLNHYLKMTIRDTNIGFNFDEFNQLSFDNNPPEDFEYNAILWYYDVETDNGVDSNLYGITFLNNPTNDDDIYSDYISTYKKLVSTEEQDGLSYQHVLNISTSVDNDTSSLSFDPLSLNNTFGFDLYSNVMSNVGKLNESFINIINNHIQLIDEMNSLKSIIYSQTDLDMIKSKLKNMEDLLKVYSTYQFVDTDTVKIQTDFNGVYPTLGFNIRGVEYDNIINLTSTNIYTHIKSSNTDMTIDIPDTSKLMLNILNDDMTNYENDVPLSIVFNKDLRYKQVIEINLKSNTARYPNKLNIFMNYDDGTFTGLRKTVLMDNIYLPIDVGNVLGGNIIFNKNRYLNESLYLDIINIEYNGDYLKITTNGKNIFGNNDYDEWVYINGIKSITEIDYSGIYKIPTGEFGEDFFNIEYSNISGTISNYAKVYSYKELKIRIIRTNDSPTSSISNRYLIEKTFI